MKNLILLIVLCVSLFSCGTTEEKMLKKVDTLVKTKFVPNLKDPSSYEKISSVLTRTVVSKDFDTENLNYYKKLGNQVKVDSIQNRINNTPDGKIDSYFIKYTYRAKNGFGALDVFEKTFGYDPNINELF